MAYSFGRNLLLSSVGFERLIDAFEQFETADATVRPTAYPPTTLSSSISTTMRLKSLSLALRKTTLISPPRGTNW